MTDIAVWRPGEYAYWYIINSKDGSITSEQWGSSILIDAVVPGDYDGDGVTDIAVWRPGGDYGFWYIINSEDGSITSTQWGAGSLSDKPVATASAPASGTGGGLMMMALVAIPADSTPTLSTDGILTLAQAANFGGIDAVTFKANDEVLGSGSLRVESRVKKVGDGGNDFLFDRFDGDRIDRGSRTHARSLDSKHDGNVAPVRNSLIDIAGKYEDFITPANGKAATRLSPSWISDFLNDLATRDYDNPNSDIKVVLAPGDETKDRVLKRKA
jgi:hypothetical protein